MKASQFTDAQKGFIIKHGEDGTPVAEVCRKAGISQATYFNWRKKHAGMMPSEIKRLRELELENMQQKKLVADLSLDKEMLQAVISGKKSAIASMPDRRSNFALSPPAKRTFIRVSDRRWNGIPPPGTRFWRQRAARF